MKKTLLIALCCITVLFAACKKKPVEPTPEPTDYTVNYVGNYLGQFTFTITSLNNQVQNSLSFPIDSLQLDIAKGEDASTVIATMTVDNETHQTTGTATEEKADFESIHLNIDKPDQHYSFSLDLKMESAPVQNDTLHIIGSFSGSGSAEIEGQVFPFEEVSGTINGLLKKQ